MNGVCFATVDEFGACVNGCRNAAAVLDESWAVIPTHGEIPAPVMESELLILSSWHERYESILAQRQGPTVPRWHSTIQQSELDVEQWKVVRILELLDSGRISGLAVCDSEFIPLLARKGVVHLPDLLDQTEYRSVAPAQLTGINISLFGSRLWRKNILVQSAAFERARRLSGASDWMLHLNGQTTRDDGYAEWLTAAGIPFEDHCRMKRSRYLSLVAAMDVGLCATLSESYCYVAAEHVALGVPVVASPAIACLGGAGERVRPDNVDDVACGIARALADRRALAARQRRNLEAQARANAHVGRASLLELLARIRVSVVS